MDYKIDLKQYRISAIDFRRRKEVLSEYLGQQASDHDVILSLFSIISPVLVKEREFPLFRNLTWDKAIIYASKGKDPKNIFESANKTLEKFGEGSASAFGQEELAKLREMKEESGDQVPELMLLCADPTPAVLDELRKIYSQRAWAAKEENDWQAVIDHLEKYISLADENREECLKLAGQAPPELTDQDKALLESAREELNKTAQ